MVGKCCVPWCKSNYYSSNSILPYTTVFKFPSDPETAEKWKKNLHLQNWQIYPNSVVCINHFEKENITGDLRKKLKPNSLPVLEDPNILENLSTPCENVIDVKKTENLIENFESLKENVNYNMDEYLKHLGWYFNIGDDKVTLFKMDFERMQVQASLQINHDLSFGAFHINTSVILPLKIISNNLVQSYDNITDIITFLDTMEQELKTHYFVDQIKVKINQFQKFLQNHEKNDNIEIEQKIPQLNFVTEQLELMFTKSKSYSVDTIIKSFVVYNKSSSAYDTIRENKLLILPSPRHLRRLKSNFNISPAKNSENLNYLISICKKLNDLEKYVVLQLDEIYVNSGIQYRGGKLFGIAENQNSQCEEAKTIQAFFISSAFGNFKTIVSLIPVKNMTSKELNDFTSKNIEMLHGCGFKVIDVISDNNRLNRSMFNMLCKNSESTIYFSFADSIIFTSYDTVHILKNIRNNWLNLKDPDKTFIYPSFTDGNTLHKAKFSVVRDIYKKENNLVVKTAPNLNFKSCYPTHFERQNVKLVLNVFNEKTISAINDQDTEEFMKLILKWWTMVNIKNPIMGKLKKNDDGKPFTSIDDHRLTFLHNFINWLEKWKQISNGIGFLTYDTYNALCHSTKSLISIIKYSLINLKVQYVLTGKFQTDNLERTFGKYRNVSGSNYNISVQQVLEAEHKLRVNKILGIRSARYGMIRWSLDTLPIENENSSEESFQLNKKYLAIFDQLQAYEEGLDKSVIMYISGYASFKISSKMSCANCISWLCAETTDDDYFLKLTRGGLTVASDLILSIAKIALSVMNALISNEYEDAFLRETHHKKILSELILLVLSAHSTIDKFFNSSCEDCSTPYNVIVRKFVSIFSNICLNNYRKLRTDALITSKNETKPSKKRKLQTLL